MESKGYNINIDGIDIIEKAVFKTKVQEGEVFNFEIKSHTVSDNVKRLLITFVHVQVSRMHTMDIFGRLSVGFGFSIENLDSILERDMEGGYIIPPDLEARLKHISISAVRGILFSEFKGTKLHNAILPVILSDSFIPIDSELPLQQ